MFRASSNRATMHSCADCALHNTKSPIHPDLYTYHNLDGSQVHPLTSSHTKEKVLLLPTSTPGKR